MKKKYLMAVLLVCSAFWTWRYVEVNAYYNHEYPECREESFSIGDEVTLIADRIDDMTNVEGYSIRVDQFEILTQEEVKLRCPESQKIVWQDDDKFALVSVTLSNTDSNGGIMLTDFLLHPIHICFGSLQGTHILPGFLVVCVHGFFLRQELGVFCLQTLDGGQFFQPLLVKKLLCRLVQNDF